MGDTAKNLEEALRGNDLLQISLITRMLQTHGINKDEHWSYLLLACNFHNMELIHTLLSLGIDASLRNPYGKSILHLAGNIWPSNMVDLLVKSGADPNAYDWNNYTPLGLAVLHGKEILAQTLIYAGADINLRYANDATLLMLANQSRFGFEMTIILLNAGADINATDTHGTTALMYACSKDKTACALQLIKAGADIFHRDNEGKDALFRAEEKGCWMSVGILKPYYENPTRAKKDFDTRR